MAQSDNGKKRLLAIDGGGLMGLIALGQIQAMEDQLRSLLGRDESFRLRDYFDYFAGTSTGGIIAAALTVGKSAKEITDLYVNNGEQMFTKISLFARMKAGFGYKYKREPIYDKIVEILGNDSIRDMQADGRLLPDKHLMLTLRNATDDTTWPISTNPASFRSVGPVGKTN